MFALVAKAAIELVDSKPLLKELKKREFRWPVLGGALGSDVQWDERKFDLLQTLAQIRTQYSKSVLLRLYVSPDDKNSQVFIIKVGRGCGGKGEGIGDPKHGSH